MTVKEAISLLYKPLEKFDDGYIFDVVITATLFSIDEVLEIINNNYCKEDVALIEALENYSRDYNKNIEFNEE